MTRTLIALAAVVLATGCYHGAQSGTSTLPSARAMANDSTPSERDVAVLEPAGSADESTLAAEARAEARTALPYDPARRVRLIAATAPPRSYFGATALQAPHAADVRVPARFASLQASDYDVSPRVDRHTSDAGGVVAGVLVVLGVLGAIIAVAFAASGGLHADLGPHFNFSGL